MLLTSNGISNGLLRETVLDLLGKPFDRSRIVVVIDAILPFADDKGHLLTHLNGLRALGWAEFDVLSLWAGPRSLIEQRLRSADVILGYGGSNLWLAHSWTATGFAPVLAELLDEKVYVGWSAGSMIFSRLLERWAEDFDDQEELEMFELTSVQPPVPLFDWFMIGHLGAEWRSPGAEQWAARGAARSASEVWFIDDASALLVRHPDAEPQVVSDGHWLRFDSRGTLVDSR